MFSLKHSAHRWENSPQNINTGKAIDVTGAKPFVGRKLTLGKHRELDFGLFEKGTECSLTTEAGTARKYVQGVTPTASGDEGVYLTPRLRFECCPCPWPAGLQTG